MVTCAVHKQFEVPNVLFSIRNKEQLERLRHIKQLGVVDRVFPNQWNTPDSSTQSEWPIWWVCF